jgi:hypothetical protein
LVTTAPVLLTATRHEMTGLKTTARTPAIKHIAPGSRRKGKKLQSALLYLRRALVGNRAAEQAVHPRLTENIELGMQAFGESQRRLGTEPGTATIHNHGMLGRLKQRRNTIRSLYNGDGDAHCRSFQLREQQHSSNEHAKMKK